MTNYEMYFGSPGKVAKIMVQHTSNRYIGVFYDGKIIYEYKITRSWEKRYLEWLNKEAS